MAASRIVCSHPKGSLAALRWGKASTPACRPRAARRRPSLAAGMAPLGFTSFANWVLPDQVLQGEYPGRGLDICSSEKEAQERMKAILSNGKVSIFVSFLHELPDQEDMPADGVDGFLPYKALALEMLSELAIKRHLHFLTAPFVVNGELSMNRMLALTSELKGRVEAGEILYLHCSGGRGRAGTAAACLYVHMTGCTPDAALAHTQEAYDTRGTGLQSPASARQRQFIHKFALELDAKI